MQMVFSASQFKPEEQVRVKGLECLVEIVASYYEYLPEYIEAAFKVSATEKNKTLPKLLSSQLFRLRTRQRTLRYKPSRFQIPFDCVNFLVLVHYLRRRI